MTSTPRRSSRAHNHHIQPIKKYVRKRAKIKESIIKDILNNEIIEEYLKTKEKLKEMGEHVNELLTKTGAVSNKNFKNQFEVDYMSEILLTIPKIMFDSLFFHLYLNLKLDNAFILLCSITYWFSINFDYYFNEKNQELSVWMTQQPKMSFINSIKIRIHLMMVIFISTLTCHIFDVNQAFSSSNIKDHLVHYVNEIKIIGIPTFQCLLHIMLMIIWNLICIIFKYHLFKEFFRIEKEFDILIGVRSVSQILSKSPLNRMLSLFNLCWLLFVCIKSYQGTIQTDWLVICCLSSSQILLFVPTKSLDLERPYSFKDTSIHSLSTILFIMLSIRAVTRLEIFSLYITINLVKILPYFISFMVMDQIVDMQLKKFDDYSLKAVDDYLNDNKRFLYNISRINHELQLMKGLFEILIYIITLHLYGRLEL